MLYDMLGKGYERVRIDGEMYKLRDRIVLEKNKKHDIEILVDEIFIGEFSAKAHPCPKRQCSRASFCFGTSDHEADGLIRVEYPQSTSARVPLATADNGISNVGQVYVSL